MELKPCPFCGGDAELTAIPSVSIHYRCKRCKASGPYHTAHKDHVEQWNTRAADPLLNWIATKEQTPPHGMPVWFWSREWIVKDYNPEGIREGHYIDDVGYISCDWDPSHDLYGIDEGSIPEMWALRCPPGPVKAADPLLKEMAEALEEIVRCLSHGLQDCRASVTAKAMLQKYHEQVGE